MHDERLPLPPISLTQPSHRPPPLRRNSTSSSRSLSVRIGPTAMLTSDCGSTPPSAGTARRGVDARRTGSRGPEHLDPTFLAGYDRKQGFPDPTEDLDVLAAHGVAETSAGSTPATPCISFPTSGRRSHWTASRRCCGRSGRACAHRAPHLPVARLGRTTGHGRAVTGGRKHQRARAHPTNR